MFNLAEEMVSGPRVARLFVVTLAAVWVVAWWSWGIQALPLVGQHGLMPLAEFFDQARTFGTPRLWQVPSLFWLASSDAVIVSTNIAGLVCAAMAFLGVWPRRMLFLNAILYISFIAPSAPFLPMLGDKVLLEATALACVLPAHRPAQVLHLTARLFLVKLYIEAGFAQWLEPNSNWQSGLALQTLLEVTPLPTPLGYFAAQLPAELLRWASKFGLLAELALPWLILGPRQARLVAAIGLTALQVFGVLFFNLGLFSLVAVALHLFCLADTDVAGIEQDLAKLSPAMARAFFALTRRPRLPEPTARSISGDSRLTIWVGGCLAGAYLALFVAGLAWQMVPGARPLWQAPHLGGLALFAPWHLVNNYAHAPNVSGARVEPQLEALSGDGKTWSALVPWHEPGDPWRAPEFVAPHQPRLDIQLSYFGRRQQSSVIPEFIEHLMARACENPATLGRLIHPNKTPHPQAIRLRFYRYTFAPWAEHRASGAWWLKTFVQEGPCKLCRTPDRIRGRQDLERSSY